MKLKDVIGHRKLICLSYVQSMAAKGADALLGLVQWEMLREVLRKINRFF